MMFGYYDRWMPAIWVLLIVVAVGLLAMLLRRDGWSRETPRQILPPHLPRAADDDVEQRYLFDKRPYDRPGCDVYSTNRFFASGSYLNWKIPPAG